MKALPAEFARGETPWAQREPYTGVASNNLAVTVPAQSVLMIYFNLKIRPRPSLFELLDTLCRASQGPKLNSNPGIWTPSG